MDLTTITAKVAVPGMHHWPAAPEHRAYLRNPHRHLFIARAVVVVVHDDREVEFHDLGDDLAAALRGATSTLVGGAQAVSLHDFGPMSCEALARHCVAVLDGQGYPVVEVSVSEDDEFTATVYPGATIPSRPGENGARRIPDPDRTPGQEPVA